MLILAALNATLTLVLVCFGKKIIRDFIELVGPYVQMKSTEKMSELFVRVLQSRKENVKNPR